MRYPDETLYAFRMLAARQTSCKLARDYYEGNHPTQYGSAEFRRALKAIFGDFRYNLCPLPIHAVTDRLQLTGMAQNGTSWEAWAEIADENEFDVLQGDVHVEACLNGIAYVLVWPDPDREAGVAWTMQHSHLVEMVTREDDDEPLAAIKVWEGRNGRWRLNVYYDDAVDRYQAVGNWDITADSLNGLQQIDSQFHGLGAVPMAVFETPRRRSDLADAVPIQNALNKALGDLIIGGEAYAIPQRWITGLETDRDPTTGLPRNPLPKGGGVWTFSGTDINLGQFQAADVQAISQVILDNEERFARVTGLPMHYIRSSGDAPSGDSLRVSESRLTSKAKARANRFAEGWEAVAALSSGGGDYEAVWGPIETFSEAERVALAEGKRRLGVPDSQLQAELGYSPSQIEEFAAQIEEQRRASLEASRAAFAAGL